MKLFKMLGNVFDTVSTVSSSINDITTMSAYYAHQSLSLACFEQDQEQEKLQSELKLKQSISDLMDQRIDKFRNKLNR